MMCAVSFPSEVYHLVTHANDKTLCGLSVVPIVIDREVNAAAFHLRSKMPTNRQKCKDCATVEQQEQRWGE